LIKAPSFCVIVDRRCLGLLITDVWESSVARDVQRENRIFQYVRETRAELRKVAWPSREEALRLTSIVVVTVLAMSAFLGIVDYVFTQIVRALLTRQ